MEKNLSITVLKQDTLENNSKEFNFKTLFFMIKKIFFKQKKFDFVKFLLNNLKISELNK